MKRARNPKRTSSQYSCTKTFVSPESGSFTTGRRVRTRDHYHQRDTLAHRTTEHAGKGVIVESAWISGGRFQRASRTCVYDHEAQRGTFKYPSTVADTRRSFVHPIPFESFLIGGRDGGGREGGREGERNVSPASWWKMKENGSLTCLK